jgi:hypothetical protein
MKWFTIGIFKDGQCVEPIRVFQLPFTDYVIRIVDNVTAIYAKALADIVPEDHYVAFDYYGRK